MSIIFDQYSERLRRKNRSPHTRTGFATAADRLDRWLHVQGLDAENASYADLEEYFDTLDLSPGSRATHMKHIKAAYNYAVKRGALRHNPALDLELPKPPPGEPITIPNEELRAIRDSITLDRDWLFFHLLAYTGLRRAELVGLRWDADGLDGSVVQLADQTIRVWGKGDKRRLVPIHPALGEVLADAGERPGCFVLNSWGKNGIASDTVQRMTKRLSPIYKPHDYRRTLASSLARNGVEDPIIDKILGWAPAGTGRRYYIKVAGPELQRAILRAYADDPLN